MRNRDKLERERSASALLGQQRGVVASVAKDVATGTAAIHAQSERFVALRGAQVAQFSEQAKMVERRIDELETERNRH